MQLRNILIIFAFILLFAGCRDNSKGQALKTASQASVCMANGNYLKAKALFTEASDLHPSCAEYHVGEAMASLKIKDSETARMRYLKALKILEGQSRCDPDRVDDYVMVLVSLGREKEAREVIDRAKERFEKQWNDNFFIR